MTEYDLTKGRTYTYLRESRSTPSDTDRATQVSSTASLKLFKAVATPHDQITASVDVANRRPRDGEEVVQCYVHTRKASEPMPIKQLWAFQRVSIPKGHTRTVALHIDTKNFGHWDKAHQALSWNPERLTS